MGGERRGDCHWAFNGHSNRQVSGGAAREGAGSDGEGSDAEDEEDGEDEDVSMQAFSDEELTRHSEGPVRQEMKV